MNDTQHKERVLIVGAGGFVGGFLAEEGLRRGLEVWCGLRASTSRVYLSDERLHFIELDFDAPESLAPALGAALPEGGKWDYIVYNLGATKCLNFRDFNRINHDYLRSFIQALDSAGMQPQKFLYMSSLSAMGPGDEKTFRPLRATDIPTPDTKYGASKLKAEMLLASSGLPYIIFRCTGIYGPRDRDYYLEFKSIQTGMDFSVGLRKQLLTFIYVEDLARAVYDALEKAPVGKTYLIAEPRSYTQSEFRRLVARELGKKGVIGVKLPLWAVKAACTLAEKWGLIRMKPSTLNRDKYHILRQRNWSADISDARHDFGFAPEVPLAEGVKRSIEWYRENGWLKTKTK